MSPPLGQRRRRMPPPAAPSSSASSASPSAASSAGAAVSMSAPRGAPTGAQAMRPSAAAASPRLCRRPRLAARTGAALPLLLLLSCCAPVAWGQVCGNAFSLDADLATASAGQVRTIAHVDDGAGTNIVVSAGEDHKLRVWDISPVSTTPRVYSGHQETVWALKWISDLSVLASGGGDGRILFWPATVLGNAQVCTAVNSCCDGTGLGCGGDHVFSWTTIPDMHRRRQIHALEWVSNGDGTGTLVSGWGDGSVRTLLYDGSAWSYGLNLQPEEYDQKDRTYDMVWMAGASMLATASEDWPHPRVWSDLTSAGSFNYLQKDPAEDVCPSAWEHCDAVLALAGDSAGNVLASGSRDNQVILWTASTQVRIATFTAHTDYVTSLAWLHSEDKLASGGADSEIFLWDATATADTSTTLETLSGHTGSVSALVWIEGESKLASADSDGNVKLWTCA